MQQIVRWQPTKRQAQTTPRTVAAMSAPVALSPRRERWLLLVLAGVQFTTVLDFMIIMPLGPQFTQMFALTAAEFGVLVSSYTLAAGLSGLLAAFYIDRLGRKRLLLVLYALFGLAALFCSLAPSYFTLVVGRLLCGAFGGVLGSLLQTILVEVVPLQRRGRAMGAVMTAFSVASVLGVPASLWMTEHWGWHAPFAMTAVLCVLFGTLAASVLPPLQGHLRSASPMGTWQRLAEVLQDSNHRRAFATTALMMFGGFTVIPFLAINSQFGVGVTQQQLPLIYLTGGFVTLFTSRWVGRMTDFVGKKKAFAGMSLVLLLPMFVTTLLPFGTPLVLVLATSACFMAAMSGRMIPGMAVVGAAAHPAHRGTFMTLNASVQSAAMGAGAWVGGQLFSRSADGRLQHFWMTALVGAVAVLLSIWVSHRLVLHGVAPNSTSD
jgi:predicted MFS family arabinose efflux permease